MSDFKKKVGGFLKGDGFSSGAMTALLIAVIIVLNVILYTLVEMFGLFLYKKDSSDLSLSGATDSLFADAVEKAKIDGRKVKISFCYTEDEVKGHDTGSFVYTTAKNFEARYPELIELEFINIFTMRNDDGELIEDMDKFKKDMYGNETMILKNTVIFEYGNNYRVITDTYSTGGFANFFTLDDNGYATAYNGEEVMAGIISWVLSSEHKTAYFTQYHGEIADLAFSNLLASAGYFVDVVDLRREEVPSDADLLVISNPTSDFEKAAAGSGVRSEIDRLSAYLEKGGNVFVALDPYVKELPVLEEFLAKEGISFSTTPSKSGKLLKNIIKDPRNAITTDGFTLVTDFSGGDVAASVKSKVKRYNADGNVILSKAAALLIDESSNAVPILLSSSASMTEAGGKTVDDKGSYCVAACSERDTENGGKAKVFVVSSIYLAVSDSLVTNGYSNRDFVYGLLDEFYGAGKMPYGCKVALYDTQTLENLKLGTAKLYTVLIMAAPLAIAVTGVAVITRRKNR